MSMKYIETISVEPGGQIPLAEYHLRRMREALGGEIPFELSLDRLVTDSPVQQKLRFVYDETGIYDVTIEPYRYDIRQVEYLRLMALPEYYSYDRKYLNRRRLDQIASKMPDPETVALLVQEGHITDTTFTNVCLLGDDGWETPDRPLLPGTRRQYYLDRGLIRPVEVTLYDLLQGRWHHISLINALNPLGKSLIPITPVI